MHIIEDRHYLHLFNCFPSFGPARLERIRQYFRSFEDAYHASSSQLLTAGIEAQIIAEWFLVKDKLDITQSINSLQSSGIKILIYDDEAYSVMLRNITYPPPILYYRGALGSNEELCLGVVGIRKISAYGQNTTEQLVAPLVEAGITIVSGLAYGVDAAAHRTAIKHGGRTIAVLGGGLDDNTIYPRQNVSLVHEIINSGGLILSEYPPGRSALGQHFVVRNRIIAGLSSGVLIVECGEKSGALITADYALHQDRNVYAVPGPIHSPTSRGTNNLLKQGAIVVTESADILRDLNIIAPIQDTASTALPLTLNEQIVLEVLNEAGPTLVDDIIVKTGLDAKAVTAALTFLEIKGRIRNIEGQQYIVASNKIV